MGGWACTDPPRPGRAVQPRLRRSGARADQAAPVQLLRDLDGIGRRPLAEVVPDDPQVERVGVRLVAADPPDEDLVPAGDLDRQRIAPFGGVVLDHEVRGRRENLARLVGRHVTGELDVERLGVAVEDGHPCTRGGDPQLGEPEDLPRLGDHLALLGRVRVVVLEGLDLREHVERDLVRVDRRRGRLGPVQHGVGLLLELLDGLEARSRDGLVAREDHALEPGRLVQRLERQGGLHDRAVRVGDDPAMVLERLGIHLGDDERHLLVHPPARGVVHDDGARLHELRGPLAGDAPARGEEGEVEALDRVPLLQRADLEARELAARRAGGGEGDALAGGEPAGPEQLQEVLADGAGGADDGHAQAAHAIAPPKGRSARIASGPSSKAAWRQRTASGTRSAVMTQEILMGEVEIISMLISCSPSVRKTVAATPGWLFMPAPTIETLPMEGSVWTSANAWPVSGSSVARAARRSSTGTVKEISARASEETGSFWTIMSTFTLASASAPKIRPASPGTSGTPTSVTRASSVEWVTAVMSGCSIVSSSLTIDVPGRSSNDERQCMRTPWLRAYSTERSWRTRAPEAAISSISSKETIVSFRALGTMRGSAVEKPGAAGENSPRSAASGGAGGPAGGARAPRAR